MELATENKHEIWEEGLYFTNSFICVASVTSGTVRRWVHCVLAIAIVEICSIDVRSDS